MQTLLIMYLVIGALVVLIAIPLIRRMVPPNGFYGFRVPQTLNDPATWYAVNAHLGRRLIWDGVLMIAAAVVCYRIPGMGKDSYAWTILAVLVVAMGYTVVSSIRYLRSLGRKS